MTFFKTIKSRPRPLLFSLTRNNNAHHQSTATPNPKHQACLAESDRDWTACQQQVKDLKECTLRASSSSSSASSCSLLPSSSLSLSSLSLSSSSSTKIYGGATLNGAFVPRRVGFPGLTHISGASIHFLSPITKKIIST